MSTETIKAYIEEREEKEKVVIEYISSHGWVGSIRKTKSSVSSEFPHSRKDNEYDYYANRYMIYRIKRGN